jgi:hypothetical protein
MRHVVGCPLFGYPRRRGRTGTIARKREFPAIQQ